MIERFNPIKYHDTGNKFENVTKNIDKICFFTWQ